MISWWLLSKTWKFPDMISRQICDVKLAVKQNVDVLSHDFWISCDDIDDFWTRLWWPTGRETWTFCHMIFSQHVSNDQLAVKGTGPWKKFQETIPSSEMWTNPYLGGTIIKLIYTPLRITWHTETKWKSETKCWNFRNDLWLHWDETSQRS